MRINKPTEAVKKLSRHFQQVANSVKSHHGNVNKYWCACRSSCQNVYRMTWVPPSLLQLSMYFLTSWDSNPFVPEGNKPIWPPSWGPDGWLSLFPILSSFVKPDPSRQQHGDIDAASSRRNTPRVSLIVVVLTKPDNHSVKERQKHALNYARGMFLSNRFFVLNNGIIKVPLDGDHIICSTS